MPERRFDSETYCPMRQGRCDETCELRPVCGPLFAAGRWLMAHDFSAVTITRSRATVRIAKTMSEQARLDEE